MKYSKPHIRKLNNLINRINDQEKLIDKESNPIIKAHYINVMRELQRMMEMI